MSPAKSYNGRQAMNPSNDPLDTPRFSQRQVNDIVAGAKETTEKVRASLTALLWHVLMQQKGVCVLKKEDIVKSIDFVVDMDMADDGTVTLSAGALPCTDTEKAVQ